MKTRSSALLSLFAAVAVLVTTENVSAQTLDCNEVESEGNNASAVLVALLNSEVAGTTRRINRRKTLRINEVRELTFDGCRATVVAHVTLTRKIRRNAHGTVRVTANVTSFSGTEVCLSNTQLRSINVSNTLRFGEAVYRWIANKIIPDNHCLAF